MTLTQQFQKYVREEKLTDVTIPTGSDLLDLVISDVGGVKNGWIYNIIGDSSSGKTFLACELIAAAKAKLKDEFNVKIAYNDCESGFNFDTEELYGFDIREDVRKSQTAQDFFTDFGMEMDALKKKDGKKIKKDDFLLVAGTLFMLSGVLDYFTK